MPTIKTHQMVSKPAPIPPQATTDSVKSSINSNPQEIESPSSPKRQEEDLFTPPPISKKPDGNDISTLWQLLLMNIKSPSTTALLKLATPLQIAPDGVVITFKNDRLVAQLSDSNKKQLIIDAANTMFNQNSTSVTVRLAQSGDKAVQPTSIPNIQTSQKPEIKEKNEPKKIESSNNTQNLNISIDENSEIKDSEEAKRLESDQEKMILDLFDGKYVE
jgi:hypothetical protein